MVLGAELARYNYPAFDSRYATNLAENRRHLAVLGVVGDLLPADVATYRKERSSITAPVIAALREDRRKINGDCYALPWYGLTHATFIALATVAVGGDAKWTTDLISEALEDLGIHEAAAAVVPRLERETRWIEVTGTGEDRTVAGRDVDRAYHRMMMQLCRMWLQAERRQAERRGAVAIDERLLHPCFILAANDELEQSLRESLDFRGVDVLPKLDAGGTDSRVIVILSSESLDDSFAGNLLSIHRTRPVGEKTFLVRSVPMKLVLDWQTSDSELNELLTEIQGLFVPEFCTRAEVDGTMNALVRSLSRSDVEAQ